MSTLHSNQPRSLKPRKKMEQKLEAITLSNGAVIEHRFAILNGSRFHFLFAEPECSPKATVFLIPALLWMGCRVVAPDMMGFGRTPNPKDAPEDPTKYTFKTAADDIAELADNWGSKRLSSVGMTGSSLEELASYVPQFAYQIQLASGRAEKEIPTREEIRQFMEGMFGETGPAGELLFSLTTRIRFQNSPTLGDPIMLTTEALNYYTELLPCVSPALKKFYPYLVWFSTMGTYHNRLLSWKMGNAPIIGQGL
ncbi:hypothetical protein K505DRAFT_416702 [Melanomma pulvis-pyrius CBS 109.77]|uniref:AB hydrolase-1 domain-containing protein n=1 Tax=Melanomma pulvis-pyrius CBS 109.77 TaxID=1314802 RepID=A0A6A6XG09_9PLEO|nr:hypothetical protein K505DRAFT_416702 [Melanomma pulvis-pyrius CBS 109.77]